VAAAGAGAVLAFAVALGTADLGDPASLRAVAALGGAAVYGARVALQLTVREHVAPSDSGKADAVTNCLAECGGALAGLPLVHVLKRAPRGWATFPATLAAASLVLVAAAAAVALLDARARRLRPREKVA
jgi:hypothetical protein